MYENLMEEVVQEGNLGRALEAVKRNRGSAGIDHMKTTELESHFQTHCFTSGRLKKGRFHPKTVCLHVVTKVVIL